MKIKKNIAISESGYIFNPSTGESFSVNPTGIELFNQIQDGKSYNVILEHFIERYNTDKNTFEKDYADFISLLEQHALTEKEDGENN